MHSPRSTHRRLGALAAATLLLTLAGTAHAAAAGTAKPRGTSENAKRDASLSAPAAAGPSCLDIGKTRNNGDRAHLWQCGPTNNNQFFVIAGGMVYVADTVATAREMCLDAGSTRNNGDQVIIWQCGSTNANQNWVIRDGQFVIADTLGTNREMCLDMGKTRGNGALVHLWQCGSTNSNQQWVVQGGSIVAADTLS
ncbi:RICIN domain-containing protein [Kitasatospora sp. NPDC092948]|uniref:RICIN domain-containing protein n=1 Tax=Kitasatospora sp. NPDC092948 TaxID=3364088 RepID=UPI00380A4E8E